MKNIYLILLLIAISSCSRNQPYAPIQDSSLNYAPPSWAPYYDNVNQVHYYYLPDIECYYDVFNQEFVYIQNANWMFSSQLPSLYSWYDFNNPFVVMLNYNVYQPWMHHHFYLSNYPQYYYRTTYSNSYGNTSNPVHGYNENGRLPIIKTREVNAPSARRPISVLPEVEQTHPRQTVKYYGENIGQPVKVRPQMKRTDPQPQVRKPNTQPRVKRTEPQPQVKKRGN